MRGGIPVVVNRDNPTPTEVPLRGTTKGEMNVSQPRIEDILNAMLFELQGIRYAMSLQLNVDIEDLNPDQGAIMGMGKRVAYQLDGTNRP